MIVEQVVEIPPSHRLIVTVPPEIPAGKAILTFTAVSADDLGNTPNILSKNHTCPVEMSKRLKNLRGSLSKNAFGNLDGIAYQNKVRKEWDV
jgi:hypothetical protein